MDDTIRCEGCKNGFPREGLETVLPIRVSCLSETKTLLFCLDCRLIEYAFQAELPPPGVNEYIDPVNGARILPRISMFEAKAQYCMDPDDLINCRLIGANFVQAAGAPGIRAMYEERDVLLVARLKYGGDVGIVYARGWFAARGEQVEVPPARVFRERRNRIREAFLTKGYYAAPELPFVRLYVQAGEGNLEGIVQNFAIGWFDR